MKPPEGIPPTCRGKRLTWHWPYHDLGGYVVGYAVRYDGESSKEFLPFFRRNGLGWRSGYAEGLRPLYGLLSLRNVDPSACLYVVEGEKCADALHALRLPCVTSSGGSGAAAKTDWSPVQRFQRVRILPDADRPGEAYAQNVAQIVSAFPGERAIEVCRLPDLPRAGDVVDWLRTRTGASWDGYGPIPREPGDDLDAHLLEAVEECAEPVPDHWLGIGGQPNDDESWDEPVPLDAAPMPQWPADVFPAPVQKFVDALAASTETPPELPAFMTLAVLATGAQRRCRVRLGPDYTEPLNLFLCCGLPSGTRKTAVLEACRAPLVEWEAAERRRVEPERADAESKRKTGLAKIDAQRKKLAAAMVKEGKGIGTGDEELARLEAALPTVPRLPRRWTGDVTPEQVAVLMAANEGCIAVLSDEGGIFETIGGRYSRGIPNLDVFLQGHAGAAIRVDRGSRDAVILDSPVLTVGLCPQPAVIRDLANTPQFRNRGLLARFLFALPASNVGSRSLDGPPIPARVREDFHRVVRQLLDGGTPRSGDSDSRKDIILSPEARSAWHEFAHRVERDMGTGGRFEYLQDWAGKFPGAVARVAGILHCARHAEDDPSQNLLSEDDMDAALRIGGALADYALIAFDLMQSDPALDGAGVVAAWIRRKGLKMFTRRDCHAAHQSRFPKADDLQRSLDVLVERGYVRQVPQATSAVGGRPSTAFVVNPAAS